MINKQLRNLKFLIIRLLRIKGNAHDISVGFTVGFLVHFIPSFGIGPVISTVSAKLFRGNPVAGFISGVTLIWLFPFLFYLNVIVGETLFPFGIFPNAGGMPNSHTPMSIGMHMGAAFFLGMVVNIISFGIVVYIIIFKIIQNYRTDFLMFVKKWQIKK